MKHAHLLSETEKRKYFRIDDIAILQHRPASDDDIRSAEHRIEQAAINKLTLKARFDSMTRELQPMLKMIRKSSTTIADYLAAIDSKLNMLSEYVIETELEDMNVAPQQINIGAGGLSFGSNSPIMTGTMLELRLILLPENTGIFSYARVVTCTRQEASEEESFQYKIALEFINMDEDVRDLITRHVLCKEQAMLMESGGGN